MGYPSALPESSAVFPATTSDYADWLSAPEWCWAVWWTGTFGKWVPSEYAALRAWRTAVGELPEGSGWFCCAERGAAFGRTHLHALIGHLARDDTAPLNRLWRKRYGLTHDRGYVKGGGARKYAAKYCTKDMTWWAVKKPFAVSSLGESPTPWVSYRHEVGTCSNSLSSMPRNKASLPRELCRRVGLAQNSWPCGTAGIEVTEKGCDTVPRTPIDLRMFLTSVVSVGPSTSAIHANGIKGSDPGSLETSHGQHGAGSGCRLTGITTRLEKSSPGDRS